MSEVYKVTRKVITLDNSFFTIKENITEYYWKNENLSFNFIKKSLVVFKPNDTIINNYNYSNNDIVLFSDEFLNNIKHTYIIELSLDKIKHNIYDNYINNYNN